MEEQRRFTRVQLDAPTELHQGGASWQAQLLASKIENAKLQDEMRQLEG